MPPELNRKLPFSKCSIGKIVATFSSSDYLHGTATLDESYTSDAIIVSSIHFVSGTPVNAANYPTPSLSVNGNKLEMWVSGSFVSGHVLEVFYMVME